MTGHPRVFLYIAIVIVTGLAVALLYVNRDHYSTSQEQETVQIPVIANQLPAENGIIPVELFCEPTETKSLREVDGFGCRLRNNTGKAINAITVAHSVVTQKDGEYRGKEVSDKGYLTFESFIHPDLQRAHLHPAIAPGEERPVEVNETTLYEGATVKRIEVRIDYVEYVDSTNQGPNERGSQILASLRKGAELYKVWLVQKYLENDKSIDLIVRLLGDNNPLPLDANLDDMYLRQGAKIYRGHLLNIYNSVGDSELSRILSR